MKKLKYLAFYILALVICQTVLANTDESLNLYPAVDAWHIRFDPYAWASQIDGDTTVRGFSNHLYLSFTDILKKLDFGAQGHLEAGKGPWSLMIDPTYLKLTDKFTINSVPSSVVTKTTLIDGGVFYRIYHGLGLLSPNSLTTVELLAGARYLEQGATFSVDSLPSISDNIHTIAPIVGMRFNYHFNPKIFFWLRGDVGGFNVDHMKSTWSATSGLAYALKKYMDIGIAYRVLKIDYENSSKDFTMNTLMYGPMIGLSFHN